MLLIYKCNKFLDGISNFVGGERTMAPINNQHKSIFKCCSQIIKFDSYIKMFISRTRYCFKIYTSVKMLI